MSIKCKSCGADVRWVVTAANKRMPLDATPDEKGLMVMVDGVCMSVKAAGTDASGLPRFTSHFATCPNAQSHRKTT